jgi:hypothetical protein
MEINISQTITYRNTKNIAINRYKIFYKGRGFWIDMADFEGHPDIMTVLEDKLILKESVDHYYLVEKKSSQKGTFLSLKPHTKNISSIAEEPLATYETSLLKNNKPEFSNLFNIEDIIALDLFKPERIEQETKNEVTIEFETNTSPQTERVKFINKMLDLAIHQKVTEKTTDKIIELVGREVDQSGVNEEILNRLNKLESHVGFHKSEGRTDKDDNLKHSPESTNSFLKLFKYQDGSGFKELVHDTNLKDFSPKDILNKVKTHPAFIKKYSGQYVSDFVSIHSRLWGKTIQLIDEFEKRGLPFYGETKKHPYENEKEYTEFAKEFKKNYRFGSGNEYTSFESLIKNVLIQEKYKNKINLQNIILLPDLKRFNLRAEFFTWVPSIENGLNYIFDGIKDHGNMDGELNYNPDSKSIKIECLKSENQKYVYITIFDKGSKPQKDKSIILKSLRNSTAMISFKSLCNWIVESDFDDGSQKLNILTDFECNDTEKLAERIGGFRHILQFYNVLTE